MSRFNYEGSEQFKPISAWGYVGYSILFLIPVIGWVFWIICMVSDRNINRRSFARSFLCEALITLVIFALLITLAHFQIGNIRAELERWPYISVVVTQIERWWSGSDNTAGGNAAKITEGSTSAAVVPRGSGEGVRPEVKEAVDGYEDFFIEYTEFMKKYSAAEDQTPMLADYAKMITKFVDNMENWAKLGEEYTLSDAESKYYTEANQRIDAMLSETMK